MFEHIKLETGLIAGVIFVIVGVAGSLFALSTWAQSSFGPITSANILRIVMFSVFSLIAGPQIIFSSFFLSILGLRRR